MLLKVFDHLLTSWSYFSWFSIQNMYTVVTYAATMRFVDLKLLCVWRAIVKIQFNREFSSWSFSSYVFKGLRSRGLGSRGVSSVAGVIMYPLHPHFYTLIHSSTHCYKQHTRRMDGTECSIHDPSSPSSLYTFLHDFHTYRPLAWGRTDLRRQTNSYVLTRKGDTIHTAE